jgi:3-hydroxyanthranilate 3,4-dioxygenase
VPNIGLEGVMRHLTESGKRTQQLWLTADSMAFIARGREYRSEFHVNPSYENTRENVSLDRRHHG